jgi:hypothetical protein
MEVIQMKNGKIVKQIKEDSLCLFIGGRNFDVTATEEANTIIRARNAAGDFLETGISEDKRGRYFWLVRNTGDNCIKIYPKKGTLFGDLDQMSY